MIKTTTTTTFEPWRYGRKMWGRGGGGGGGGLNEEKKEGKKEGGKTT